jgi:hypothetical protein
MGATKDVLPSQSLTKASALVTMMTTLEEETHD